VSTSLLLAIPAHNERDIIAESVRTIAEHLRAIESSALLVVDNGSIDGTASAVTRLALPSVDAVYIEAKGKGIAILHAARHGREADFFGFIDADLSVDPKYIQKLLEPVVRGEADIVIGSRLSDTRMVRRSFWRTASSRVFNALRLVLLGVPVQDSQCGLKIMNARGRTILKGCEEEGWFLDLEFLARAHQKGLSILELPVAWDEHRFANRASKLRLLRDGLGAVRAMIRIRMRLGRA
jgi:dolichyl-phosphate beta-glucosyltransferase